MHICSIIPLDIFRNIAVNGTAAERAWALEQLASAERLRGRRELASAIAPAYAAVAAQKEGRRTVFDAHNRSTMRGTRVRGEGDPATGDPAADEAYDGAGATREFYSVVLSRNSVDGAGMRLDSTVHYGVRYANAFWNGAQMVYGDGDGRIFGRFTRSLDVIAHELTHGLTQFEAALKYEGQAGSLNEHFSDVFGSLVKQYAAGQTAEQADWLIGAELFIPKSGSVRTAVRSMKAPGTAYEDPLLGKDPQPAHMRDYVETEEDNGGVHVNSGIPNHAFYLAARALGGSAWQKGGLIWYRVLCERLRADATFEECAKQTVGVAGEMFGSDTADAIRHAWSEVGVKVAGTASRRATGWTPAPLGV